MNLKNSFFRTLTFSSRLADRWLDEPPAPPARAVRKGKLVIEQDVLVRSMTEATSEVFSMMLDMRTEFAGFARDAKGSETGLIGFVGITGAWGGSGLFCCSPALAGVICDRMLGGDRKTSIDEEVLDVVAEVTNMMIGNVKNALEVMTGPMAISVPTVIHGRNFQFRNAVGLRGAALSFTTGGERFEVRITLAPASEQGFARSRISVPGLASVQGGPDGGRFVPASHLAEENSRAEIE